MPGGGWCPRAGGGGGVGKIDAGGGIFLGGMPSREWRQLVTC